MQFASMIDYIKNIVGSFDEMHKSYLSSVYKWKGKIENDNERLLIIKTIDSKFDELERYVKANHSYECPEIIALEVKRGSQEYIDWAKSVISVDKTEG